MGNFNEENGYQQLDKKKEGDDGQQSHDDEEDNDDQQLDIHGLIEKYKGEYGSVFESKLNSSLGIPYSLSEEELEKRRKTKSLSLIISYCDENIAWIPGYIGDKY